MSVISFCIKQLQSINNIVASSQLIIPEHVERNLNDIIRELQIHADKINDVEQLTIDFLLEKLGIDPYDVFGTNRR